MPQPGNAAASSSSTGPWLVTGSVHCLLTSVTRRLRALQWLALTVTGTAAVESAAPAMLGLVFTSAAFQMRPIIVR